MKTKTLEVKQIDWFDDHWYKIRYLDDRRIEVEEYFASVTTKLNILAKPHLIKWYGDIGYSEAKKRTRQAADRGTRIHYAWYTYVSGGAVIYQNERTPAYDQDELNEIFKRYNGNVWILENQDEHWDFLKVVEMFKRLSPDIVEAEKAVYHIDHREAGTADNIFNIKEGDYEISGSKPIKLSGGMYMGDLKTGAQVGKEAFMQISAYVHCAESMGYDRFQGALIYHTQGAIRTGIEGLKVYVLTRDEIDAYYADFRDISRVWERQESGKKPIIRQMPCLVALNETHKRVEKNKPEEPKQEENKTQEKEQCQVSDKPKSSKETGKSEKNLPNSVSTDSSSKKS